MKSDAPRLEAIVAKPWGEENLLMELKTNVTALGRKTTSALTPPKKEEEDGEENNQQSYKVTAEVKR